jgi:BMFP domain-containing protein YqiC
MIWELWMTLSLAVVGGIAWSARQRAAVLEQRVAELEAGR